jgi:hypothetical protein
VRRTFAGMRRLFEGFLGEPLDPDSPDGHD